MASVNLDAQVDSLHSRVPALPAPLTLFTLRASTVATALTASIKIPLAHVKSLSFLPSNVARDNTSIAKTVVFPALLLASHASLPLNAQPAHKLDMLPIKPESVSLSVVME